MIVKTYIIKDFDEAQAQFGTICIAIKPKDYPNNLIMDYFPDGENLVRNDDFGGAAICRYLGEGIYMLPVDGKELYFDSQGNPTNKASKDYVLRLGEIYATNDAVNTGSAVSVNKATTIRKVAASATVKTNFSQNSVVLIEDLNARDQFAVQFLNKILGEIKDPTQVNETTRAYYCDVAYKWAANMMKAAAEFRGTLEDQTPSSVEALNENTSISSLDNNVEKLLNRLVLAIEKNTVVHGNGNSSPLSYSRQIDISEDSVGGKEDKPLHIKADLFPTKDMVPAQFNSVALSSFLTFDFNGAVGNSTLKDVADAIYKNIEASIDNRIKTWLYSCSVVKDGEGYKLDIPSTITV